VDAAAAGAGRAIEAEHFGVLVPFGSGVLDPALEASIRERRGDIDLSSMVAPSIEALGETIAGYVEVGMSKFVCLPLDPVDDVDDEIERFAAAVAPLENDTPAEPAELSD
jgi:hypothetical protein